MRSRLLAAPAMLVLSLAAQGQPSTLDWARAESYGDFHIVTPENPSETLEYAARVFQKYWKICTGEEIGISPLNEGLVNVWLGPDVVLGDLVKPWDLEGLGREGFIIRTYTPTRRYERQGAKKHLIITGAAEQGTLNAVFDFLEQFMRVRWLAPGVVSAPRAGLSLPRIDYRFVPAFALREVDYHVMSAPETGRDARELAATDPDLLEYRRAHKFDAKSIPGPFGRHTFYDLLPPDQYFDEHPEYYSEVGGERIALRKGGQGREGQLCCGNPEVADAVLASLIELIQANPKTADAELLRRRNSVCRDPGEKVWSVSRMNCSHACDCAACRAIDEQEGARMGSLLTLVNRVAEGIEKAFPDRDYKIHTLASGYSRKPPKTLRPRDNVIIELCDIDCDFSRPLDDPDSPVNAAFVRDIEAWSDITENLHVRDCVANLRFGLCPHPNFHVLQSNLRLFDQYDVQGVYVQGANTPGIRRSDFDALRAYVLSVLIWDPDYPVDEAIDDFLERYYRGAADLIRKYINLITEKVVGAGARLECFSKPDWFDRELAEEAEALFQEALSRDLKDEVLNRLAVAHLPVQYATLLCTPRLDLKNGAMTRDRFIAAMKLYGEGVEGDSWHRLVREITEECGGNTPP